MPQESTQPLRVAFYARVSTEEQREGQTIDSQLKELEKFAEASHWAPVGVYKDEGWSGAMLARPELDRLRDDAQKKPFDVVLINDVDRLARDVTHLNVIRRDLERKGVRVVFRKLPGELSPTQNLMINILGSFAEFEREMILDRTRRGVRYKVEIRKLYLGCRPAYGYGYTTKNKSTETTGKLEISPEEAAVVRKIYNWVDKDGLSAHQVLARLNRLQIPARKRGRWAKSSVLRVLRNEMYAGVWHYNKHYSCEPLSGRTEGSYLKTPKSSRRLRSRVDWIPVPLGNDLTIVPRDQWERVQKRITGNISWSPRNSKHNYLLRGLVRCAGCNARLVGDSSHGKYFYRCHKRCKSLPMIGEERLNNAVWSTLRRAIMNPGIIALQAKKYYEQRRTRLEAANINKQQAATSLAQLENEEQRLLEAYRQGILNPTQLGSELEKLKARRNSLQPDCKDLGAEPSIEPPLALETMVDEYCRRVSIVIDRLGFTDKQNLLRMLVREMVFNGKQVLIKGRIPYDETAGSASAETKIEPVSPLSGDCSSGIETTTPEYYGRNAAGIETTMPKYYGRNLVQLEFELAETVRVDPSKANAARKLNLIKAMAARWPTISSNS